MKAIFGALQKAFQYIRIKAEIDVNINEKESQIQESDQNFSPSKDGQKEGEDYGYMAFNETVDAYFVGKNTYDEKRNIYPIGPIKLSDAF